jgi:hexosaminidase
MLLLIPLLALIQTSTSTSIWPQPQHQTDTKDSPSRHLSSAFKIQSVGLSSSILNDACTRYIELIQPQRTEKSPLVTPLVNLQVNVTKSTSPFSFGDDESYKLEWTATSSSALLTSNTVVGALRGLETFAQIVEADPLYKQIPLSIPAVDFQLTDAPRYPYRGLMMDLSRHYYTVQSIQHTIEAMVANKLNVLHLHLTDDQSFPVESIKYPELAEKGAFQRKTSTGSKLYTYSKNDIVTLSTFASDRGVLLLPEFDMPAHSSSWGASHPEIMVTGGNNNGSYEGGCSQHLFQHGDTLNPIKNDTYELIDGLLGEMAEIFPPPFLHLGGDEVPTACWASHPEITDWMKENGIAEGDYNALESYFVNRVAKGAQLSQTRRVLVYWEEIFNNNVKLAKNSIIQAWKSTAMSGIVRSGYRTTNSYKWYLNHGCNNFGDGNWGSFYTNDPMKWARNASEPPLTPEQQKLVLGGETTMWSECVDAHSFDSIVWPRASASAEQLWSSVNQTKQATNVTSMRLSEFRCRLIGRGIQAAPIDDSVAKISPRDVNIGCM